MDFVSAPLSNSLFPFIDCDVKDEELRVIMDGRHICRAKTQGWGEERRRKDFACQCYKPQLKMVWDSNTELLYFGFGTRVNIFHLFLKREEFEDIFKYWVQREII